MIQVVKFVSPVHFGGDAGDVSFYKRDGEGAAKFKDTTITDPGQGFLEVTHLGRHLRVPYTNVAYMALDKSQPVERPAMRKGGQL